MVAATAGTAGDGCETSSQVYPRRFHSDVAKFWSSPPQRLRGAASDVHELAWDRMLWRGATAHFLRTQPTDRRLRMYADLDMLDL